MLDAHFGDVDLARATALLAYYSRRTTDRPPATSGFTTTCEVALAVERLGELGLAPCHAMADLRTAAVANVEDFVPDGVDEVKPGTVLPAHCPKATCTPPYPETTSRSRSGPTRRRTRPHGPPSGPADHPIRSDTCGRF